MKHHLILSFSHGAGGVLLAATLSPRLVFSLSCCHLPSRLVANSTGSGYVCPCSGKGAGHSQLVTDVAVCGWEMRSHWAQPGCTRRHCLPPTRPAFFPQIAKQSLRPYCTVCNRYFKTPRKFVEHVKSQGHKDKAKEVTPAPSQDMGPERYRALARATQQVEVFPSLNAYQVWRDWDAQSCGVGGVWRLGCPELT